MPAEVLESALAALDAARVALAQVINEPVKASSVDGEPKLLLRFGEAGAELGASRTWIFGAVKSGLIPAVTIEGLGRRIRRQDLEAYVESLCADESPRRLRAIR